MRKDFLTLVILTLMTTTIGFVSCSNDDEPEEVNPSKASSASIITNDDGDKMLLTSLKGRYDNMYFSYDEKGRLEEINYGYDEAVTFDYDEGIMYLDEMPLNFTITSQGYITSFSSDITYGSSYIKMKYNISYDGSGHMTEINFTYDTKEEYWSAKGTAKAKYTWKNGNLVSTTMKVDEEGDDEGYYFNTSYKCDCKAEYGKSNKLTQPTVAFNSMIFGEFGADSDAFISALTGMLGKAPEDLCTNFTREVQDESDEYENIDLDYTFNDDGTIYKETTTGTENSVYTYSYREFTSSRALSSYSAKEPKSDAEKFDTAKRILKTFFKHVK